MSECRCGHDQLLHADLCGPCALLTLIAPHPIGCGCRQFEKAPAAPKVDR